jgi:hypothetical protein
VPILLLPPPPPIWRWICDARLAADGDRLVFGYPSIWCCSWKRATCVAADGVRLVWKCREPPAALTDPLSAVGARLGIC